MIQEVREELVLIRRDVRSAEDALKDALKTVKAARVKLYQAVLLIEAAFNATNTESK